MARGLRGLLTGLRQALLDAGYRPLHWGVPRKERPRCGAKCRDGHPCRAPVVWDEENNEPKNGRCKLHGGLSTGPKTKAGRERIAAARRAQRGKKKAKQETQENAA